MYFAYLLMKFFLNFNIDCKFYQINFCNCINFHIKKIVMNFTLIKMEIILIKPRGFCAGVERAITIVELALEKYNKPIYVKHEIVHNKRVVEKLQAKGVIFVKNLEEIPDNSIVIFSAHGVSNEIEEAAKKRLLPLDATCPLVKKVHHQGQNYIKNGRTLILIGHKGHPEIEGTLGRMEKTPFLIEKLEDLEKLTLPSDTPLAYITQTTLSYDDTKEIIEALEEKFTNLEGPKKSDICYATQNRQKAVKEVCKEADLLLVLGSKNSSNSNRLREVALNEGLEAYLIDKAEDLNEAWLEGKKKIAITAGASAPEELVEELLLKLQKLYPTLKIKEENFGIIEKVEFKIQPGLFYFDHNDSVKLARMTCIS
jgi:4-hydroxy-3-methylbut-2-enyl diphosphate reductase